MNLGEDTFPILINLILVQLFLAHKEMKLLSKRERIFIKYVRGKVSYGFSISPKANLATIYIKYILTNYGYEQIKMKKREKRGAWRLVGAD